jgi:hypothetical protein
MRIYDTVRWYWRYGPWRANDEASRAARREYLITAWFLILAVALLLTLIGGFLRATPAN